MDRARLTPVDVIYYGAALFILALMIGPMYKVLNASAGELSMGSGLLFQMVLPAALVTIISVVYLTGASGGTQ